MHAGILPERREPNGRKQREPKPDPKAEPAPGPLQKVLDEEQRQLDEESKKQITDFERMRQAEVEAGRVVKRVKPDGRIEYSMPSSPEPAPGDSPTSTQ
jgi:hypothetical protein